MPSILYQKWASESGLTPDDWFKSTVVRSKDSCDNPVYQEVLQLFTLAYGASYFSVLEYEEGEPMAREHYIDALSYCLEYKERTGRLNNDVAPQAPDTFDAQSLRDGADIIVEILKPTINTEFCRDAVRHTMEYATETALPRLAKDMSQDSVEWLREDYEWFHYNSYSDEFDRVHNVLATLEWFVDKGLLTDAEQIQQLQDYRTQLAAFDEQIRPLLPRLRGLRFDGFQLDELAAERCWWLH